MLPKIVAWGSRAAQPGMQKWLELEWLLGSTDYMYTRHNTTENLGAYLLGRYITY